MQNLTQHAPAGNRFPAERKWFRAMRVMGALAVLVVGAVHLEQYLGANFRTVPTIGPLFLLNSISCGVVGFALLMPVERVLAARRAHLAVAGLAIGGVAIAFASLVALLISETGSLFGFSESGYRVAVVVAIAAEVAAIVLLAPVAAVSAARAASGGRGAGWTGRTWARPRGTA